MKYQILLEIDEAAETVSIGSNDNNMPYKALVMATEHLMTLTCMEEPVWGFKKRLKLLIDGCKSNKVKQFRGNALQ